MKTIKRKEIKRKPSAPGEILKEIFLDPRQVTQASFAEELSGLTKGKIKVSTMKTKLNEVVTGRRAVSAEFALLISEILGTNPKMWLNLQASLDLWNAKKSLDLAS